MELHDIFNVQENGRNFGQLGHTDAIHELASTILAQKDANNASKMMEVKLLGDRAFVSRNENKQSVSSKIRGGNYIEKVLHIFGIVPAVAVGKVIALSTVFEDSQISENDG